MEKEGVCLWSCSCVHVLRANTKEVILQSLECGTLYGRKEKGVTKDSVLTFDRPVLAYSTQHASARSFSIMQSKLRKKKVMKNFKAKTSKEITTDFGERGRFPNRMAFGI